MSLDKIKKKKLRLKLRYLQTELEETRLIYDKCLTTFNTDFSQMLGGEPQPQKETPKDPYKKIETEVDEDSFKDVYREIASKTHPDKGGDTDKFKKANEANRNKDFGALLEMADEVGVEVEINNEIREQIHKHIKAVSNTITNLKTTMAWTWVHVNEDNRDTLKQYILQQLQVS